MSPVSGSPKFFDSEVLRDEAKSAWGVAWGEIMKTHPELADLIDLWPSIQDETKGAIMVLVKASSAKN